MTKSKSSAQVGSRWAWTLAAGLFMLALPARAQDDIDIEPPQSQGGGYSRRGQGWSVLSGKTVGSGATVIQPEIGWPGISVSLLHGLKNNFDLGGRFTFNYGYEGITFGIIPGLKLQGVLRVNFVEKGRFNFGLEVAPGPMFYFQRNGFTRVGLAIPAYLCFGLAVGSAVMINFGFDMPLFVQFTPNNPFASAPTGLYVPILFGAGLEYFIDRNMALTFNMRMGPTIFPTGGALFTFESLFGLAFRL